MKNLTLRYLLVSGAMLLAGNPVMASDEIKAMLAKHGCTTCHSYAEPSAEGEKLKLPIGPSFPAIAQRFYSNDNPEKYQELYRIIKHGSSPYRSYFQGKVKGLAMPPNDETISDLDINRMLVWILTASRN